MGGETCHVVGNWYDRTRERVKSAGDASEYEQERKKERRKERRKERKKGYHF